MRKNLLVVVVVTLSFLPQVSVLALDGGNESAGEATTAERTDFIPQSTKLNESIEYDVPALPSQGEMHKSQEGAMGDEPIRPGGRNTSPELEGASVPVKVVVMKVSAYCDGSVFRNAKNKQKAKRNGTGITCSGKKATVGTVSADLSVYPLGTVFNIPGYGEGVVRDCGGGVTGDDHIDVFMGSYRQAIKWGVPKLKVRILKLAEE